MQFGEIGHGPRKVGLAGEVLFERMGHGQVILFAAMPGFRGQFRAGARLFSNAVVYGPGAGASQPIDW